MGDTARYLLSVFGPAERNGFGVYRSKEATLEAFADTGAFDEKLEREGHRVIEAVDLDQTLGLAVGASKACRSKVEARPSQSPESVQALLES